MQTKEQQFKNEDIQITNAMDIEAENRNNKFIPIVGMKQRSFKGNGLKGTIEYVGDDYFILRSFRTEQPVLILPHQYHNFTDYITAAEYLELKIKEVNDIQDKVDNLFNFFHVINPKK